MGWMEELTTAILWMIIFSELYSVIWHIYSINYKEQLPELDSFKLLLNGIAKLIKSLVTKTNKTLEEQNTEDEKQEKE